MLPNFKPYLLSIGVDVIYVISQVAHKDIIDITISRFPIDDRGRLLLTGTRKVTRPPALLLCLSLLLNRYICNYRCADMQVKRNPVPK